MLDYPSISAVVGRRRGPASLPCRGLMKGRGYRHQLGATRRGQEEEKNKAGIRQGAIAYQGVGEIYQCPDKISPTAAPILDTIVLALYAAPTYFLYHEETADVTSLPDARRSVFHPDI